MDTAVKQWDTLIKNALQRRLTQEQLSKHVLQLHKKSRIPGVKLATILFERITRSTSHSDPRIPSYIDTLLEASLINSADVLSALLLHSRTRPSQLQQDEIDVHRNGDSFYAPQLESNVLLQLTRRFVAGSRPKTPAEARLCFRALSEWMNTVVAASANETMMHAMGAEFQQQDTYHFALVREALGQLLIAVLENTKMIGTLETAVGSAARKSLSQNISAFVPIWAQLSPQFAARLESAQKIHHLVDERTDAALQETGLDMAAVQVESVLDLPALRTRSHLYVFISAMSVGLPLTDETMILSYLNHIFKGDIQNLIVDLITASFDAISGAQNRHETKFVMFTLRSFLINKVPSLMAVLVASSFQGLNVEYCITEALSHLDQAAFPTFSDSFLDASSPLSDVRQDFVFSCTRHGLLPTTSVERLLGEAPMTATPTPAEKYLKETLVAQCMSDPNKIEPLIDELEKVDGNGAAIAQAITELLRSYCATKETMSLKNLCNALSRRQDSMDVMLQFTSPCSIVQPLCTLLDGWRYDDDQGEYQPVYDEFAAVLLLVLAFIHRYSLDIRDIGLSSSSFIARLLVKGHVSRPLEDLSEEERKFLDGWILGLFNPEGMDDEVMSACRPQEFYLLVPSIVSQAVYACTSGVLDIKTVKSGLEYLSLPFLLPSLVGGIAWLCDHAWTQPFGDSSVVMQLLQKMVRPPSGSSSSSGDAAQAMHATVISILQPKIESHLRLVERREPQLHGVIDHLQQAIKPFKGFHVGRVLDFQGGFPDGILSMPGGLEKSVRATVQGLTVWSTQASVTVSGVHITQPPPSIYSPRVIQLAARFLTPSVVVNTILEEVKVQSQAGNGSLALDVATALVCAPTAKDSPVPASWTVSPLASPPQSRSGLNLREALKLAFDDAQTLMKKDEQAAQTTVRLYRRVEGLCMGVSIDENGALSAAAAAAAAAAVGAASSVDALAVDTETAAQMQLDDAMGLNVASAVDPMAGLLGTDPLQPTSGVFDAATAVGMAAAGMDLTTDDLTGAAGGSAGDLGMELMPDGEDDMFAGLDLGGDLNFD